MNDFSSETNSEVDETRQKKDNCMPSNDKKAAVALEKVKDERRDNRFNFF